MKPRWFLASLSVGVAALAFFCRAGATGAEPPAEIAIEELAFEVDRSAADRFTQIDHGIWTAFLAEQPGFLGKEVWFADGPEKTAAGEGVAVVKLIIRWRSLADWRAIPPDALAQTQKRFDEAMAGVGSYRMTWSRAYALRSSTTAAPSADEGPAIDVARLVADAGWRAGLREISLPRDPTFGGPKRFRAAPLADLLRDSLPLEGLDQRRTMVVFECGDGYRPTLPLADALAGGAWVATEDLDPAAGSGDAWAAVSPDGARTQIGPAYLVWPDDDGGDPHRPWPYGLVRIRIATEDPLRAAAAPKDPRLEPGYEAYATHCAKCHRVRGVGGDLGPELAWPKAVTQYWRREELVRFVRSPQSFRAGSKMPAQAQLDAAAVESILDYLDSLAE